jgi:hypothetical protein
MRKLAVAFAPSLLLLVAFAIEARATTIPCSAICAGSAGACDVVSAGLAPVPPGSVVNCAGRNVNVKGFTTLKVDNGSFKLIAASLEVGPNAMIKAVRLSGTPAIGLEIEVAGAVNILGSLQADAITGGGRIVVDAGANIAISNDGTKGVEANGTGTGADGGDIELRSRGSITIQNPIRAESEDSGETVGGHIWLDAVNDVTISMPAAKLLVNGYKMNGGSIHVNAGRDISIANGARLEADGRNTGANGGGVYLTALNRVDIAAAISVRGGIGTSGPNTTGGVLQVESGCGGVRIAGNLDVRAGEFGGGAIEVETMGDLAIAAGALLDARATGFSGPGGEIGLNAGGKIMLASNAIVDVRANTSVASGDGRAGIAELLGCEIDVASGAKVLARGFEGGEITVEAASGAGPQVTTLHLGATSQFDATSTRAGAPPGKIRVAIVNEWLTGYCTTDPTRRCTLDAPDCIVGCSPGECRALNPDTEGTLGQFVSRPDIYQDKNLTGCANECTP